MARFVHYRVRIYQATFARCRYLRIPTTDPRDGLYVAVDMADHVSTLRLCADCGASTAEIYSLGIKGMLVMGSGLRLLV